MNVALQIDPNTKEVSATMTGANRRPVNADDITKFHLDDASLKAMVDKKFGKSPPAVWTSGGGGNALYKKYSWPEVLTVLKFHRAEVVEVTTEVTAMTEAILKNVSETTSVTYTKTLSVAEKETYTQSWSKSTSIGLGMKVGYSVGIPGDTVSGEFSASFDSTVGTGGTSTKEVDVTDTNGITVTLPPGKQGKVTLTADKHKVKLRVYYTLGLDGDVAINYDPPYEATGFKGDHYFYAAAVVDLLANAQKPTRLETSEEIEMTYYGSANTVYTDL